MMIDQSQLPEQDVLVFAVTVRSTEPPPNWPDDALAKLRREMELMYGKNADVEIQSYVSSRLRKMLADAEQSRNGDG